MDINQVIRRSEYSFLSKEPLGDMHPVLFLTFGGSYAYGTNVDTSDVDIRGICGMHRSELLGQKTFEQFEGCGTDTTIYGLNKAFSLFAKCNPNTIEMLGGKPEAYTMVSEEGRMILDNASIFLSNRCIDAFGGYAAQQLHRLENAIARDRMTQAEQEMHILQSCQNACSVMSERYQNFGENGILLQVGDSEKETFDKEILMTLHLDGYPLRDFCSIWSDLNEICKNYGNLPHRERKKDDRHLSKHMMHLFRLNLMCYDLLTTGKVVTFREKDHDFLMSIRNGKYIDENGRVLPEFYDILHESESELEYAKTHSVLPKNPDEKRIEELLMELNSRSLRR